MKINVLILIAMVAGSTFTAIAQPTLTVANSQPTTTDKFFEIRAGGVPTSYDGMPKGPNVTWDFTNLIPGDSSARNYMSCSATPGCNNYPASNLVDSSKKSDPTYIKTYTYYQTTSSKLYYKGTYESGFDLLVTTDPMEILRYPFTMSDNFVDSFKETINGGYTARGQVTVTADGYGTLKLPGITYQNVLRVHRLILQTDNSPLPTPTMRNEYIWYLPGTHQPILDIRIFKPLSQPTTQVYCTKYLTGIPNSVVETRQGGVLVNVWPNPNNGNFRVSLQSVITGDVTVKIMDISGRILHQQVESARQSFDMKLDAPAGVYFMQISAADGSTATEKLVVF